MMNLGQVEHDEAGKWLCELLSITGIERLDLVQVVEKRGGVTTSNE